MYAPQSLFEDLLTRNPELRLFRYSPVVAALDFAAQAFPIFQPEPMIADEHPLTAPPALPEVAGTPPAVVWPNLLIALGMVALAGAVMWTGAGRGLRAE